MKKNIYFLFCTLFVFGYSYHAYGQADNPPLFLGGSSQSITVCKNSGITSLNSYLAISDSDAGQTETWSILAGAIHGSLIAGYSTTSTGSIIIPSGLTYAPAIGYSGNDSFTIKVSDGIEINTMTIYVTINPAPIIGLSSVCVGSSITLSDATAGGLWSSSSTSASIGMSNGILTGMAAGGTNITYTSGTCITTKIISINAISDITGSSPVCAGTPLTLNDIAGSGVWSSNNTSVATVTGVGLGVGSVIGLSGGTATITFTTDAGCTATTTVTINQIPSPVTGTASVCSGLTTTLVDTTIGGAWSPASGGIATVNGAGMVTGVAAGTAVITYALPTGCKTFRTVTVYHSPAAITPLTPAVCAGSAITLSDVSTGGTWSSSNSAISTVNPGTGVVTGASAGTVTISYMLAGGCLSTKNVTVHLTPSAITGTTSVCEGSSITLGDGTAGGTWSTSSAIATVGAGTGTTVGVSVGSAVITYTVGSCVATTTITVNAIAPIATGVAAICANATLTLSDPIGGGTWSSNNTMIATATTTALGIGLVTGVSAGTATISYTMGSGCFVTTPVIINPLPSPITGIASVCAGSATTLADIAGGGFWSPASGLVATIDATTGSVTGVSAGTAMVTYTLSTGCRVFRTVTVNPLPSAISGITSVCEGLTTTLIDTIAGGAWSSGNTATATVNMSTGTITGISAGVVTISYTLAGGCFSTKTVIVNLTPSAITGPSYVCTGFSIFLNDTTPGGSWSYPGAFAAVGSATGIVTGVASGSAAITYTVGSCIAAKTITINPISPITGDPVICNESMMTFHDITGGGVWAVSNAAIATVATVGFGIGNVTGISGGTAILSYTLNSCTVTDTLLVNPLPAFIGGTLVVCQGLTTTLSDATGGGAWSSSDGSIATVGAVTGIVTGVAGGTSVITYTLSTGCVGITALTVNPTPIPIIENSPICIGLTNYLHDGETGTWSSSNTAIATIDESSGAITSLSVGNVVITYTMPTGCIRTDTIAINYCDDAVGTVTAAVSDINVFPNPNNGTFSIKGSFGTTSDAEVSIDIADMLGRTVYRNSFMAPHGNINEQIALDNLSGGARMANGMYILNLRSANGNKAFHLMVGK